MSTKEPGETDVPALVWKYTTADTAKLILESGKLQWSSPFAFTDPLDMRQDISWQLKEPALVIEFAAAAVKILEDPAANPVVDARLKEVYEGFARLMREDRPQFDEWMEKLPPMIATEAIRVKYEDAVVPDLKKIRILCLTTQPDSADMWREYGESNRGAVFEFDGERLKTSVDCGCVQVEYTDRFPKTLDPEVWVRGFLTGKPPTFFDSMVMDSRRIKRLAYKYEREVRLYTRGGFGMTSLRSYFRFPPLALKAVTLGRDTSRADEIVIRGLVARRFPNASVQKA